MSYNVMSIGIAEVAEISFFKLSYQKRPSGFETSMPFPRNLVRDFEERALKRICELALGVDTDASLSHCFAAELVQPNAVGRDRVELL